MTHTNDPLPIRDRMVSVSEAVKMGLGSRATIHRQILAGTWKTSKVGGKVLLHGNSMLATLEANANSPDAA